MFIENRFTHPSGQRIPISDMTQGSESDVYQYHGTGLKLGDCGLKIMNADISDSGVWSCHAGNTGKSRFESQKDFTVRVSGNEVNSISFEMKLKTFV